MSRLTTPPPELNERDKKILQALADGFDYGEAAKQIGHASNYVKHHLIPQIIEKLGADNKTHAVAMALRRKLID